MTITLERLRTHAIARSLFRPTTLARAIDRLGFVQADPIRAPARAQDLILRHRVAGYRAGDLERRYPALPIEEDFFVNYGFMPHAHHASMHPRTPRTRWTPARWKQAREVLAYVEARGTVHPQEVHAHFDAGQVLNWFGGTSNATTQLLDGLHYRGLLRVVRRSGGTRVYGPRNTEASSCDAETARARMDRLVDLAVGLYAPVTEAGLKKLVRLLGHGVPQWRSDRAAAVARAKTRLASSRVEGASWYWPAGEDPCARRWRTDDSVRLLAPFDPVVWDRDRFERLWGWAFRFEAYTPASRRQFGYYALPLLHRDRFLGWATVTDAGGTLACDLGFVAGRAPRDASFRRGLDEELERLRAFLVPRGRTGSEAVRTR